MFDVNFYAHAQHFLRQHLGAQDAARLWRKGEAIADPTRRALYLANLIHDVDALIEGRQATATSMMLAYKYQPVGIEEFIKSKEYLDKAAEIYPKVLEELIEINSGKYHELVCTGGIGSAKTTTALYTTAYQTYLLSCLENPHKVFGLDPSHEILIVFQSINKAISTASFKRFRHMIEQSPYFKKNFPWDPEVQSRLDFPHRISVLPVSGNETAAIGQNVIAGMIDELNYMTIIERSKQSVDQGQYNQAVALYNSIARRRKTRFSRGDKQLPGILCLVSSKRYPGQFTDQKEAEMRKEIEKNGRSTIYLYDYRVWDVKPANEDGTPAFSEERFHVFIGDLARKPRILLKGETVADGDRHLVDSVPTNFLHDYETDIINALRELSGKSTLARHPFFVNVEAVAACFGRHRSIFSREVCDFVETKIKIFTDKDGRIITAVDPKIPRFAHVDLAISGDSAGLAIGCCPSFKSVVAQGQEGMEMMPLVHFDGLLQIRPPRNAEILFWKIREVILMCRKLGLNIRWVTYDSFESTDSMQLLRQQGFVAGMTSIDRTAQPYDFLKGAVYSSRVLAPTNERAKLEMVSLEKDTKTGKIDHPPLGSKDVTDAMAGVVWGLTMRRAVWGYHHIKPVVIPGAVRAGQAKADAKDKEKNKSVDPTLPTEETWYVPA